MLGSLLLLCGACSLARLSCALVQGNLQLEDGLRHPEPFLSDLGQYGPPPPRPEPGLLPADDMEEHFLLEAGSYDEDVAEALQLQGRAMRSPRRCTPHQQSCLGHALPCCDPCDTCYCRFFNAICYCRRVGQACTHRRT
ncbi:agouti-related protein [Myripristis murdjan]|uniref:Agouti-related protein n=1 Tax=Myripristis murdjan TaxID=586833 RepID=A0A667ZPF1_9TELE|nr:agouti-related protein-like [Myripristis murdjan]